MDTSAPQPHHHHHRRPQGSRSKSPITSPLQPHTHHRKRKYASHTAGDAEVVLPNNARKLVKGDLTGFRPLLGLYLDIQKGRDIDEMGDGEVKGRWKSFLGKWNRGELASGYYDSETLEKAVASKSNYTPAQRPSENRRGEERDDEGNGSNSDSAEEIGPVLPSRQGRARRLGPTVPGMDDLQMKREMEMEDNESRREDIRHARKADRTEQKALLEELLPRADVGRERQLEKKKLVNEKMKGFREKSPDGGAGEVPDSDLMGEDGVDGFKRRKKEFERKKTEREIRKEEHLRARAAEREERLREYREKEEGTIGMLKALAKQRFG